MNDSFSNQMNASSSNQFVEVFSSEQHGSIMINATLFEDNKNMTGMSCYLSDCC